MNESEGKNEVKQEQLEQNNAPFPFPFVEKYR